MPPPPGPQARAPCCAVCAPEPVQKITWLERRRLPGPCLYPFHCFSPPAGTITGRRRRRAPPSTGALSIYPAAGHALRGPSRREGPPRRTAPRVGCAVAAAPRSDGSAGAAAWRRRLLGARPPPGRGPRAAPLMCKHICVLKPSPFPPFCATRAHAPAALRPRPLPPAAHRAGGACGVEQGAALEGRAAPEAHQGARVPALQWPPTRGPRHVARRALGEGRCAAQHAQHSARAPRRQGGLVGAGAHRRRRPPLGARCPPGPLPCA
jgi:hypothetical protein